MHIEFSSPLAAATYADMLRMPQHTEALQRFIATRLTSYESDRWRLEDGNEKSVNGRPREYRMHIGVSRRDTEQTDHGLYCRHIEWLIQSRPADERGYFIEGEWEREINGGLFNHGTVLEPNWSVHT